MSTASDYLDRTYDLSAFQGLQATGMQLTPQRLTSPPTYGTICTGIAKLAQRFIIEFLTPRGSMPFRTERGCSFLPHMLQGRMRTEMDVFQMFAYAMGEVGTNLRGEEVAADPPDERFDDAELVNAVISGSTLSLVISLTSRAGNSRPVILPIPVLPQGVQ